jgi:hypothetical protein
VRFKLDENMPVELRDDLRALGYDADTVPDEGLAGQPEGVILEQARVEGRILFTLDKGIADVRRFPPRDYAGIVLFRPASTGRGAVLAFARRHLSMILATDLAGRLVVASEFSIRVR